ncbi:inositol-3-phosphate synthase [Botrimarina sp.]|uniref:inositol-3-phosphate synthase n=1 Tax=Botrimarina sp. TaxID=2795802 RepID=UPI0032EB9CC9
MTDSKTGVWFVGARGSVATTATVGLAALVRGEAPPIGLVTESLGEGAFAAWDRLVVGGHDIRGGSLADSAAELERGRVLPPGYAERFADELADADARIRPGVTLGSGAAIERLGERGWVEPCDTPAEAVRRVAADLAAFREATAVERLVVVLLGSTEPPVDRDTLPPRWEELSATLGDPARCPLRPSSLYAIGAIEAGAAVVNFTPSLGAGCPAIDELARRRGVPHAGADGKTGETLLKATLAPMFAARNLKVDSWVGHNLLGNRDGAILADAQNKQAKVESKERLLAELLGYAPQSLVSIEPIESLGDWKTAWDHIHFRGFLGVPMTLQFTWQGSDSALAAPLVLDLARLADLALRRGESGALGELAAFFKSPVGDRPPHALADQMRVLKEWLAGGRPEA